MININTSDRQPEPFDVAQAVEMYVDSELRDAERFSNRAPLDGSGVYGLHQLAAQIYAMGWAAGHMVGYDASTRSDRRDRERATRNAAATTGEPT